MPNYLRGGYEFKRFAGPVVFGGVSPDALPVYETKSAAHTAATVVGTIERSMIEQERRELIAAERAIDPFDRAVVELALKWGAEELRVPVPRVRFFAKSSAFDFDGLVYRHHPDEIWVSADQPWYEQVRLALHELKHTEHIDGGDHGHDSRERDATEYARRHLGWAFEAAKSLRSMSS